MLGCSNWSLILKRKEMPEQNYAVAMVPLLTPGDRWASGKLLGNAQILALGPRRAPYRVLTGILCLVVENEPTAGCGSGVGGFPKATGRLAARI